MGVLKDSVVYAKPIKEADGGGCGTVYAHSDVAVDSGIFKPNRPYLTIYDGFYHGWKCAKEYGDLRFLASRSNGQSTFKWLEYKEVELLCSSIASRLGSLGLNRGDIVGIYSRTRIEWLLTFLGCQFRSCVVVPLYDTLGDESIDYILRQTECKVVFTSTISEAKKLISLCVDNIPLKHIIVIDWPADEGASLEDWNTFIKTEIIPRNVTCESFQDFTKYGSERPLEHEPPLPTDVFEICYTSGTTGRPKGAIYHHDRMVTECLALKKYVKDYLHDTQYEVMLCYLPLAHSYELAVEIFCTIYGYKLGYFNGDPRKIIEDVQALKPTLFTAVPRVLNRVYDGIMKKTSRQEAGVVRSLLFNLALRRKIHEHLKSQVKNAEAVNEAVRENIIDKLFFRPIRQLLGGNLKLIFVGSAATPPKTLRMLRATLGNVSVCEGYGLTEAYGISLVQVPMDKSVRCVGGPVASLHVKVVDVPELGYLASNGEGELCLKGHSTISGYYKQPEESSKTVDSNGWIHTGDVAKIHKNGSVSIIDRTKDFFKLAQGEYVIPARVETAYKECREVENIVIYGTSAKNFCVAIVFPNTDALTDSLKKAKIHCDPSAFHKSKQVKEYLSKSMDRCADKSGLKGFEKAKNIYICETPLTELTNLLTPTLKVKRHLFFKHFEREIARLYESTTPLKGNSQKALNSTH